MSGMQKKLVAVLCMALLLIGTLIACSGSNNAAFFPPTQVFRAYVANVNGGVEGYVIESSGTLTSTGTTTVNSPSSITIDPKGRFAFVVSGASTVSAAAFTINAKTGELTSAGSATTGGSTIYASVDPLGRFLYAPNWDRNDVAVFSIDQRTGALTKTDCGGGAVCGSNPENFGAGSAPYGNVAFDAKGKYAYLANQGDDTVSQYDIDQTTGALSNAVSTATGTGPGYVVVHPSGKFAYVANTFGNDISAYTISATTGTLSQIDCGGGAGCSGMNFAVGVAPTVIAIDSHGKFLYSANYNDNTVSAFTINSTTGALSAVSGSPYSIDLAHAYGATGVAIDPSGKFLYATSTNGNLAAGFQIDSTTGQLTPLSDSPFSTGPSPYFITTTITSHY